MPKTSKKKKSRSQPSNLPKSLSMLNPMVIAEDVWNLSKHVIERVDFEDFDIKDFKLTEVLPKGMPTIKVIDAEKCTDSDLLGIKEPLQEYIDYLILAYQYQLYYLQMMCDYYRSKEISWEVFHRKFDIYAIVDELYQKVPLKIDQGNLIELYDSDCLKLTFGAKFESEKFCQIPKNIEKKDLKLFTEAMHNLMKLKVLIEIFVKTGIGFDDFALTLLKRTVNKVKH